MAAGIMSYRSPVSFPSTAPLPLAEICCHIVLVDFMKAVSRSRIVVGGRVLQKSINGSFSKFRIFSFYISFSVYEQKQVLYSCEYS